MEDMIWSPKYQCYVEKDTMKPTPYKPVVIDLSKTIFNVEYNRKRRLGLIQK